MGKYSIIITSNEKKIRKGKKKKSLKGPKERQSVALTFIQSGEKK